VQTLGAGADTPSKDRLAASAPPSPAWRRCTARRTTTCRRRRCRSRSGRHTRPPPAAPPPTGAQSRPHTPPPCRLFVDLVLAEKSCLQRCATSRTATLRAVCSVQPQTDSRRVNVAGAQLRTTIGRAHTKPADCPNVHAGCPFILRSTPPAERCTCGVWHLGEGSKAVDGRLASRDALRQCRRLLRIPLRQ
jgi:hypothetical protein